MEQIFRRESKRTPVDFRDDISEYSSPSNWGDKPGPLYFGDHLLMPEGLQARRTVGEAILKAEWERPGGGDRTPQERFGIRDDVSECSGTTRCLCLKPRTYRVCLEIFRQRRSDKIVFTWQEISSIMLLPFEESGPYLLCVMTFKRQNQDGQPEFVLQAATLRGRARWGIEMMAGILRDQTTNVSGTRCCAPKDRGQVSLSLFMDMARIACEVARLQPSMEGLERLIEALDLLAEGRQAGGSAASPRDRSARRSSEPDLPALRVSASAEAAILPAPHFPLAALRRFGDAARRASADFAEWRRWREISLLLRPPRGWDLTLWQTRVLTFIMPQDESLRDIRSKAYPASVDRQLTSAAERWRRTLS